MKKYKSNYMTERKYIADKRILAYNPFERIDEDLFEFMDGYTFLDFLKLNRGFVESFTTTMHRPIDTYYSSQYISPVVMSPRGYIDVDMELKISVRKSLGGNA